MLNTPVNDIPSVDATATSPSTVPAPIQAALAPAPAMPQSGFSTLLGAFAEQGITNGILPNEAVVGCTIISGGIKFGEDMKHDFGDFLVIRPVNMTRYQKANLGVQNPSADEKKMAVNCYDGETVTFDEQTFTKDEFLAYLRTAGYSKAKWEERAVIHALYVDSDRHDKISELLHDDDIFAVYLSPSSLKAWDGFLVKANLTRTSGYLKLTKNDRSWNGVNWTQFAFATVPAVERQAA